MGDLLLDVLPPDGSTLGDLSALAQLRACRADTLRAQMDAAEYKHLVLGLIFLKTMFDSFARIQHPDQPLSPR